MSYVSVLTQDYERLMEFLSQVPVWKTEAAFIRDNLKENSMPILDGLCWVEEDLATSVRLILYPHEEDCTEPFPVEDEREIIVQSMVKALSTLDFGSDDVGDIVNDRIADVIIEYMEEIEE